MNDEPKPLRFTELFDKDISQWRDLPVTKLLLQELRDKRSEGLRQIHESVNKDEIAEARINAGALNMLDTVLSWMYPGDEPGVEPEDPFTDPAALAPKRGKTE